MLVLCWTVRGALVDLEELQLRADTDCGSLWQAMSLCVCD